MSLDSPPPQLRPFLNVLHALGWQDHQVQVPANWPQGDHARGLLPKAAQNVQPLYLMNQGVRELVILYMLEDDQLPRPRDLASHFLDFDSLLAQLFNAVTAFTAAGEHVLILDSKRFFIYDLDSQEPLLNGNTPQDREDLLYPLLSQTTHLRDQLSKIPRRGAEVLGAQLAHFFENVRYEIGGVTQQPPVEVNKLLLQLAVSCFYFQRNPRDAGIPSLRLFWDHLPVEEPLGRNDDLLQAIAQSLDRIYRRYSFPIFATEGGADEYLKTWEALGKSDNKTLLSDLLAGFLSLMPTKYQTEVWEYALLDQQEIRKTMQQLIREPISKNHLLDYEGATVLQPLEVDVQQHGIGWGLETLRVCLDLFEEERLQQVKRAASRGNMGHTPDLFQKSSPGANELGIIEDPVMMVLNDAVRWTGITSPEARQKAEVLIALTVWEWLWEPEMNHRRKMHTSFAALPRMFS
jgi:hypothetical protein